MDTDFGRSDIFELIAQNSVRFFIHEDILTRQSQPFREAIKGPWEEPYSRKVNLTDWDEDTIGRLVQFLYTGDYRYPDPNPIPEVSSAVERAVELEPEVEELQLPNNRPLTPLNECLQHILPTRRNDPVTDAARLAQFDPPNHDFKVVLLSHAKVYALAHYKSIDALRTLALERLLMTLSHLNQIQPDSHLLMSIVDSVAYVYANTDSLTHSEEPLRKLTSQFIALNLQAFQTEPEAVELIGKGGDFVKDVMAKVCRRLPAHTPHPNTRYVSKILVGHRTSGHAPPPDHVQEVNGLDANINYPITSPSIWLVPEYATNTEDACTGFGISGSIFHNSGDNLGHSHGVSCYIVEIKEQHILEKVTGVALLRSNGYVDLASLGYDGISDNIRYWDEDVVLGGEYLYLVWKSVKTPTV